MEKESEDSATVIDKLNEKSRSLLYRIEERQVS